MENNNRASVILWLVLPILFMVMQIGIEIFVPAELKPGLHSEYGPHEAMQSIIISLAFIFGLITLPRMDWKNRKPICLWMLLATVCCLYVSGEEISWGQHVLQWSTPEYWAQFNDQDETNLHNTSSWLDQKPRAILFVGIVVGGLIVPALRKWRPDILPKKFASIYPASYLVPSAIGVLVPYLAQHIYRAVTHHDLFTRVSELQELYMYLFVLLYILQLRKQKISQV